MPYVPPPDELARRKKTYYRTQRPDLDPQSTVSKIMEFFGADEPYREDSGSYDYRQKKWDKSKDNPDASWMLPELSDSNVEAIDNVIGPPVRGIVGDDENITDDRDFARAMLREVGGGEPPEKDVDAFVQEIKNDAFVRGNFVKKFGREPTEDEWADWKNFTSDRRTTNERNAGAVLNFLDLPLLNGADEVVAGAISGADDIGKGLANVTGIKALDPQRGSYEQELALARKVRRGYDEKEKPLSARNLISGAGGFGSLFLGGPAVASWDAANAAWRGGRAAMGLAPEAASLLGRTAQTVFPGAAAGAADFAGLGFNEGEGGFDKRLGNIKADDVKAGAIGGGLLFPALRAVGSGAMRATKAAGSQAKRLGAEVARRLSRQEPKAARTGMRDGPEPGTPRKLDARHVRKDAGDESLRDMIEAVFKKRPHRN